jgi:hypothetical protein
MKRTIPILIVIAIGLFSGCSLTNRGIDMDIAYSWTDSGTMVTINYTLINRGVQLSGVVVTFGADLTTGGNNEYGDPEDLAISTPSVSLDRNTSEAAFVIGATGTLPVEGVGVISISMNNPPDD